MRVRQRWSVALILGVLALGSVPTVRAATARDTVIIGMAQEPDLFGPFSIMNASSVVENAMFAYPAPFNDRWRRVPVMVEKLPTIKDGDWVLLPNHNMKVTWRLRRGFTWHDGRPVTALDWRFTYGMLRNPRTPDISRFIIAKVNNVLIPDVGRPYSMVVQWKELWPFAGSAPFGDGYPLPRHLLETAYLRDPERLKTHPYWRAPVGHGPYRFVEWTPGSHITLEAYNRFPLGPARIRRLVFRFILDSGVLAANQITGGVDATEINNFDCVTAQQIERRQPNASAYPREGLSLERIDFNLDHEWLRDRRMRLAIAHAVDRDAIAELACPGRSMSAHTWLPPRHPASHPQVRRYAFDQTRSRALLAEAGFVPGADGILRDGAGRRLELTIMSTAGNARREQIEQVMQEQLKQVGIDLRIDNRPASVLFGQILNRRQFPHLILYLSTFTPEVIPFNRFHSTQIPRVENNWEGDNRSGWRNPENDRILEQLASELDENRRIALLRRQQELFAEDLPTLPLFFGVRMNTAHRALRGLRPTGLAQYWLPWNAWEWQWREQ